MPEHTPGPWTIDKWEHIRDANGQIVESHGLALSGGEICLANDRLIAAAPDLLEALQKLCNEAAGFLGQAAVEVHGLTNMRVLQGKINDGRAAIAKATGK